jgi:Raf kinase inhibitor-like YbhB/YbcL family protein
MKKIIFIIVIAFAVLTLAFGAIIFKRLPSFEKINQIANENQNQEDKNNMKLTSPAFENNSFIPAKYTCDGENISPPLRISDVPQDAASLSLIVSDPDAPSGDFKHWILTNIDPKTSEIAEGQIPQGSIVHTNSFGKKEWGGPCPPSGTHHYQFKLSALDSNGQTLEETTLIGLYKR